MEWTNYVNDTTAAGVRLEQQRVGRDRPSTPLMRLSPKLHLKIKSRGAPTLIKSLFPQCCPRGREGVPSTTAASPSSPPLRHWPPRTGRSSRTRSSLRWTWTRPRTLPSSSPTKTSIWCLHLRSEVTFKGKMKSCLN